MGANFNKANVERAYARWSPVYDLVFGAMFEDGRRAAIEAAERIGGRILEVGVGTGISLPDYAGTSRLVGVDLSEPMLRKARARVAEQELGHVEALAVMDAEHLALGGSILRRGSGAICHHHGAASGGHARRICARHQAGRRDRADQSHRRRIRAARLAGETDRAAGAPAWLAAGISLQAADRLGRAQRRRARRSSGARCRRSGTSHWSASSAWSLPNAAAWPRPGGPRSPIAPPSSPGCDRNPAMAAVPARISALLA